MYDVSSSDTPTAPSKQYVIQLPRIDDTGSLVNGTTVNRAGAQSSIVALNDHQVLILSRDGNGRGASGSPVFKSILLADLSTATELTTFDAEGAAVAPGGVLNVSVTPIRWTEALNMLAKLGASPTAELAKFGLNLNSAPGDRNTLSEKWEALGLVPVGDGTGDYFLFIGNDNDSLTQTGKYLDANGILQDYNAGLENDTMVLAYRVAAIPEPETYALMIAGLVLIAGILRRRRAM